MNASLRLLLAPLVLAVPIGGFALVACGSSESTSSSTDSGAPDGSQGSDGATSDGGDGGGDLTACQAAGGIACFHACAGSYTVASATACGGGLFCCADSTASDAGDAGACDGSAPLCFGANIAQCCGNDPAGDAVCVGGAWKCGNALAPGCNGTLCTAQDGG